ERADGDLEVAQRVDAPVVAWLDHRRRVELLDDGRSVDQRAGAELLAAMDRRLVPAAVEPDVPAPGGRVDGARAVESDQALERDRSPSADDGRAQAHELGAHLAQLHAEALRVRALERLQEILAREVRPWDRDGQHV